MWSAESAGSMAEDSVAVVLSLRVLWHREQRSAGAMAESTIAVRRVWPLGLGLEGYGCCEYYG